MYAVAQKRWLRIYDRGGTELHCIKGMYDIRRLEYLPRHFLLVGSVLIIFFKFDNIENFPGWKHIPNLARCFMRKRSKRLLLKLNLKKVFFKVASFPTGHGALEVITQNSANAIILSGDSRGTVSMWSPNSKKPLVEMLAHKSSVLGVAVDPSGTYMATTGIDNRMRLWDLRTYRVFFSIVFFMIMTIITGTLCICRKTYEFWSIDI